MKSSFGKSGTVRVRGLIVVCIIETSTKDFDCQLNWWHTACQWVDIVLSWLQVLAGWMGLEEVASWRRAVIREVVDEGSTTRMSTAVQFVWLWHLRTTLYRKFLQGLLLIVCHSVLNHTICRMQSAYVCALLFRQKLNFLCFWMFFYVLN